MTYDILLQFIRIGLHTQNNIGVFLIDILEFSERLFNLHLLLEIIEQRARETLKLSLFHFRIAINLSLSTKRMR